MPSNLTDASSFDDVSAPLAADIRNAASVRSALQTVANRTRFLYDRLTALADVAALKALTPPADGTIRHVKKHGVYTFDAASVAVEALPYVVAPAAGSGRWFHSLAGAFWKTTRTIFQPAESMGELPTGWSQGSDSEPGVRCDGGSTAHFWLSALHDGATLLSVQPMFVPFGGHVALPAFLPTAEVFSIDDAGSVDSPAGGYSTYPSPGSVAAYEAAGFRSWTITMTGGGTVINRATKLYYANFTSEGGANSLVGLRLVGFKLNFINIPDLRAP